MRILISGGFGFVGGRLAQYLQIAGHQVVLGSRKSRSPPEWLREAEVVTMDWNDCDALAAVCAGSDVIIHAAGMNAEDSIDNPVAALAFNGLATARLLDAGCKMQVKRFVYLSTAHVYGSPLEGMINEDTFPRNLHPYASSHLAGESAVLYATQRKRIEGIVLRLSNAFGAPAHKDVNCWMLLVNDLCRQSLQTRRMVLRSNGMQQRDFITLEDVAGAIYHLLNLDSDKCIDGLYNLGGSTISVWEMTQRIEARCHAVLGFRPEIIRPEPKAGEHMPVIDYNCGKLQSTGWQGKYDIEMELDSALMMCSRVWG
jgi:UDP-glucose 4-epimerase